MDQQFRQIRGMKLGHHPDVAPKLSRKIRANLHLVKSGPHQCERK